jgi:hypothetical protein
MSAKVWKKYDEAKIKRFSVGSTVDNELADGKLQTLDEVGVASRCLDEPFGLHFSYILGDPIIISTNFIHQCPG